MQDLDHQQYDSVLRTLYFRLMPYCSKDPRGFEIGVTPSGFCAQFKALVALDKWPSG